MTEIELLIERAALHADAAAVTRILLEDGSAAADTYALERHVADRLAAFKAAGGVL